MHVFSEQVPGVVIAEEAQTCRITESAVPIEVAAVDSLSGRIEQKSKLLLLLPQGKLYPPARGVLADLAANICQHCEKFLVRLSDLAAEELHDTQDFTPQNNWETQGSMQPFFCCNRRSWEVGILDDVRNPRRLAAGPDPAGQSNPTRKGSLATDQSKLRELHGWRMPGFHTVQGVGRPIRAPHGTVLPFQSFTDSFKDS